MTELRNQVMNDPAFKEFLLQKPALSQASIESYIVALVNFVDFTGKPFYQTVDELRELQNDRIENNIIIRFNPNQSKIKMLHYEFINYLKEKGSSDVTLNSYTRRMRALFNALGLFLPKYPDITYTPRKWYVLTKEDIKYVLDCSNVHYKAIINFAAVTGLRITDICSLKVKDFMKATSDYHSCSEVEDFLDAQIEGMMGFWELRPHKTQKNNIQCKVFNTPESSNAILLSLNERVKYFELLNETRGTEFKLTKNDPLFANRSMNYKGSMNPKSLGLILGRNKHKLRAERERVFKYRYEQGEISKETFDESMSTIPNFHAHGLRKFFITTLAQNRVDARISAVMEGHVAPIQTDSHYVNSEFLKESIKDEYLRCVPDLSFEKVEVRFLTSEERKTLEEEVAQLREENRNMKENMEEYVDTAVEDRVKDNLALWLEDMGYEVGGNES